MTTGKLPVNIYIYILIIRYNIVNGNDFYSTIVLRCPRDARLRGRKRKFFGKKTAVVVVDFGRRKILSKDFSLPSREQLVFFFFRIEIHFPNRL